MIYHIFNYRIQGEWYRDSATYSEAQFERIMEALDWKLPVHMQIYHYGSPDRKYYDLTNAIVVKRPVLSLDPMALAVSPQEKRTSVYDKQREISWPVVHRLGRFLICQPDDDWPRFCYADGDRFSLITPMDITPVSIKEAMEFVRQNHRHCSAPQGHKFSIGLVAGDGARIGVAIASIPKARALNDGRTLELNRICCDPVYRHAASKLCAATIRIGKEMGYHRFVTYTLPQESGSGLRAVGFLRDGLTSARPLGWNCRNRPRRTPEKYPTGVKIRWILETG